MTIYFKNGFYDDTLGSVPEGAVAVGGEEYAALLAGQAQGGQIAADADGKPVLIPQPPTPAHELNLETMTWEIGEEQAAAYFAKQKTALANRLAEKADELKNSLLAGYPQVEIDSFYRQEKEALARQADNNAPTPMLAQIAAARGVELDVLIGKVIEKSARLAVAAGAIIGRRQQLEDRLNTIETAPELDALEKEIEEWTLNLG
ncbi:TPA: hypothetical protein WGQ89_000395 [Neisseria meningitidis]|uniref:hypothetical protein n=1 Tax=Neisseria lactamica TaxID=486 RepID=UPI0002FAA211|nr:hypothetical protein [Neisseria lactamica]